jgi:hypothetical protein
MAVHALTWSQPPGSNLEKVRGLHLRAKIYQVSNVFATARTVCEAEVTLGTGNIG